VPELVILGSAGWIPQDARMTTSLALRFDDALFVFDAGTGLARLGWHPLRRLLPPIHCPIHLFLTHLHLDHTMGLTFLPALWSNPTIIHVPQTDEREPAAEALDGLLGGKFFPLPVENLLPALSVEAALTGETRVEGHRVVARRQDHPGGSFGYRVDDSLAFVTDCVYDPNTVSFARDVRLLVHEAWVCELDDGEAARARLEGHSSAEDAARVARDAAVGQLLLSHLPLRDESYFASLLERARAIFPRTELCSDGLSRLLD
jgi:ribonuclease Z